MQDLSFTLKFGGGINSAASEDDVMENEAVSGQNFILDYKNRNLSPRNPIKKLGTAPNGGRINGFINHVDSDGVATIVIQAGTQLYNWDEVAGFRNVGTVSSSARLRGHERHYWPLDDVTIITDLALSSPVLTWNGSAIATMTHNLSGDFKAKYCWVDNEKAYFSNIVSNSTAIPHMTVASKLSDYQNLSTSDRPTSSIGAADPFYLLTPDLRSINGMLGYFGNIVISTEKGSIYSINGSDSSDTTINPFYPRSYTTGNESMAYAGNDVILGRLGRIESLVSTQNYGDIATDDLTVPIKPDLSNLSNWLMAYNSRTQKIYIHADSDTSIWQYSKDVGSSDISPWVKLKTLNSFGMNPTTMMSMIDPTDNLEYVYMGDSVGNIYKIEGDRGEGDCGENDIDTTWRSGILKIPQGYNATDFSGYVSYRALSDTQITLRFIFGGSYSSVDTITVPLKGATGGFYFGGENYFGGDAYFGSQFTGSFKRESITPSGTGEEMQIEISHTGTAFFEINEIGIRFTGKTNP